MCYIRMQTCLCRQMDSINICENEPGDEAQKYPRKAESAIYHQSRIGKILKGVWLVLFEAS